jgi:ELWxxDGT repeat protein
MRGSRIAGALFWLVLAAVPAGAAELPYRLADINRTSEGLFGLSEEPSSFFELGGRLLFSTAGSDTDEGILWSTDGTAAGTLQISSSICPLPCHNIVPLKVWNGIALLRIGVGDAFSSRSFRLARTDGTAAGTYLLADSLDADPIFGPPGFFYFVGCKEDYSSCEIRRSDGTRAGTSAVPAANHLPFTYIPHSFASWQGKLCFVAFQEGDSEYGLWCSDGSMAGTIRLADIQETPDDSQEARVVATPSRLFYTSGETGEDLWVTDGTPEGSRRLADFAPVACSTQPHRCEVPDVDSMIADGDAVYFVTHRQGHGAEIWRSDGTEGGTRPLTELPGVFLTDSPRRLGDRWIFPAAVSGQPVALWTAGEEFAAAAPITACEGGECPVFDSFFSESSTTPQLFLGEDAAHGLELWVTDGRGTRRLSDVCPGSCPGFLPFTGLPARLGVSAGRTWFRAYSSPEALDEAEDELWVTDGTPEGTRRAAGHVAGSDAGFLGGLAYFGAGNLEHPASELWSTDGSAGAARRVTVLRRFAPGSSPLFQPLGDGVLLYPSEANQQPRLWESDGTPGGTAPLDGFPPDASRSFTQFLPRVGSLQFFEVSHESGGAERHLSSEVWRGDGSSLGTRRVAALDREASIGPSIAWAGKLLFIVANPEGCSLWSSDGTAPGTQRLFRPLPGVRCPTALADLGSRFLFIARVKAGRHFVPQVFVSDGTPAGTRQISVLQEPREPFYDDQPAEVDGTVYFRIAGPFDSEPEIWQTDGVSRTRRVSLLTGAADLYAFGGSLYFTALQSEDGRGLFRVSPGGGPPVLLARISPFPESAFYSLPAGFSPVGDRLLFAGTDLEHGAEIWITDGTPAGTRRLRDLQPGPGSSVPQGLVSAGDRVFFSADDGAHGRELWESDGTPEGTRLVADLAPGGFSALAFDSSLAVANGFLFFSADDGRTGFEPWALRLEPSSFTSLPARAPSPGRGRG